MIRADFDFLAQMLKRRSGLTLTPDKDYLIESRLEPIAKRGGLDGVAGIISRLKLGDERLAGAVTEAMTINETFFFRDKSPFDQFEKLMFPAIRESRLAHRKISIWCAAASTGQEPYSLAMLVKEQMRELHTWNVEILGTDISNDVLARAKSGLYSQFEVQRGLPVQLLMKYFLKESEQQWRLKDEIRSMVRFQKFNLLDPCTGMGPFDIVYCRNVLIYFDEPTKRAILERVRQTLTDDGYLVLGAAESVFGVTDSFVPLEGARGIYQRRKSGADLLRRVALR